MPNPKTGTVTAEVGKAVTDFKEQTGYGKASAPEKGAAKPTEAQAAKEEEPGAKEADEAQPAAKEQQPAAKQAGKAKKASKVAAAKEGDDAPPNEEPKA